MSGTNRSNGMMNEIEAFMPLRDVVFYTLRDAILKGEMAPGERLMEIHLANKLGVSRTPIREAIRMLEKEGLAVTIPRRGAQVAKMTEKDLEDVLEVRDALDGLAVENACSRMTEGDFERLRDAMREFKEATTSGDVRATVEADEVFHQVIYEAAHNPKLLSMIKDLKEQMYRYRYEYIKDNTVYPQLVEEHEKILEGLQKQDVTFVRDIMHTHLMNQIDAVRAVIRRQNEEEGE